MKQMKLGSTLLLHLLVRLCPVSPFNILDYTHYLDYLPLRQEGLAGFEDFRTSLSPPSALRNRKMEIGTLKVAHIVNELQLFVVFRLLSVSIPHFMLLSDPS